MKFLILISLILSVGCATQFKEAHRHADGRRGAFGYRIEPVQNMEPFTNYAAFTGNKETGAEKAKAFTQMAALKHCREIGKFLIIDSKVRNVQEETIITKKRVYRTGDMSNEEKRRPSDYQAYMVLFGCSEKNSPTKINERKRILDAFCSAKDSTHGKYCSPKSEYRN
jgi:hypothetical protein